MPGRSTRTEGPAIPAQQPPGSLQQEIAVSGRLLDPASRSRESNLGIHVQQLHARYLTAAAKLADAHDMEAQHHERVAQSEASTAEEHRSHARKARQAALHIRTAAHQATYPEDADLPPDARHTP
ncbi:hypothetical protein [Streptomyces endophyticus]|uniref:Uncharacterized protein n=1 Tax=Streptomyces endophyticus TaxID=714166 RepID=A0ABU6EYP1_9ACTN|nr:hypothetical protein [Streptomyces endophyticus]MEB8336866.1 hypothetical protein [Streptomyces endophyticus]